MSAHTFGMHNAGNVIWVAGIVTYIHYYIILIYIRAYITLFVLIENCLYKVRWELPWDSVSSMYILPI